MTEDFDRLDDEVMEGARSPVSGMDSALAAGSVFRNKTVRRGVFRELPAYLIVQSCWFMAFGLQMVLFPYLITNKLGLNGTELGLANMALAAPSVVFLLIGGVVAERADGKMMLMLLHSLAAIPPLILAFFVHQGWLVYFLMVGYGMAMGTIGAFMMPARDSILNEVVDRRVRAGSGEQHPPPAIVQPPGIGLHSLFTSRWGPWPGSPLPDQTGIIHDRTNPA